MFLIWAALACLVAADLPEDLRQPVEVARQAPAELAADLLIRFSGSPKVRERGAKRELLEEAFERAQAARYASAVEGDGPVEEALRLGLSRVGLQTRVVRRMISVSPVRAERLFLSIEKPDSRTLTCDAAVVPSWAEYHAAFHDLLQRGGAGFPFITAQVRSIRSPEELEPIAERIRAGSWTDAQFRELVDGYALALRQMAAGPLAFHRAAGVGLQQQIFELTRRIVIAGRSPRLLIEAWRRFLVSHMSGTPCEPAANFGAKMVAGFNESLLDLGHSRGAVAEISAEETRAVGIARLGRLGGHHRLTAVSPSNSAPLVSRLTDSLARANPLEWRLRLEPFLEPKRAGELLRSSETLIGAYAESVF